MSPEAIEIQAWFDSEKGRDCTDGSALGVPTSHEEYLRNRLWLALTSGIAIGRRLATEELPIDLEELGDIAVRRAMEQCGNRKPEAAELLGIGVRTLQTRLHRMESQKQFRKAPKEART